MSYQALKWVDRDKSKNVTGTKLNAANLNNIENGIVALETALGDLTTKASALTLTDDQVKAIADISALKTGLADLQAKFDAHVHSNEAGDTTGGVVIESSASTSTTDSSSTNGQDSNKSGN